MIHAKNALSARSKIRGVAYALTVENLFAKLKDWRRIATRYDRCAHTFFSAICIAAAVIFWL
jgi:transposase